MKTNQIGNSKLHVSEIGLGTMSLGTDRAKAVSLIHEAVDNGVTFIDTADLYDFGLNEEIVGEALRDRRDSVVLATKAGNHFEEGKEGWYWDPSKKHIKGALKDSLRRLKTDHIDLFQLHGGTIEDPIDETIEAFEELKSEGLIIEYGISSIRPNVIREFVKKSSIASVMMQYSILDRRPEEEMLDLLHDNNISVIARGPLAKGMLTDRYEEKIKEDGFLDYSKFDVLETVKQLNEIKGDKRNMTQTALKYALAHPAVATVIPGASRSEQLLANITAQNAPDLTPDEVQKVRDVSKKNVYDKHR
ncbi:aldo/keto reductase [Bacillus sp. N1-1]|jgi:aryl-alcohol dehydrogenase-like predicted oxidoreductase|uniref:aldo/keto reductase n=1 Tax=Bacillus sp. N1-1 TaxID=2682541 RepID=UPI001316830F|nr:aldo/keto reductase [Bacillus sp. N1-1]QHA92397.1 aldo/keto reductase [Bacillus sp. N1-1]